MPSTDVTFGITRYTGALIESVETDDTIQVAELAGSNGEIARVHPYQTKTEFSVKGHGTMSVALGVGSSGITGLDSAGVSVIKSIKKTDGNNKFDDWDFSGTHYPSATAVT